MKYPTFFDTTETITLYDPLSNVLGAFENGEITFSYLDVVKSAGHSCPTMAGAYLMIREGLKALYPHSLPERGAIKVFFKETQTEGTTGVIANAFSLITGATDTWGFKGLSGKYVRKNLMDFSADIPLHVRIQRVDTGVFVDVAYNPNSIEIDPKMQPLMQKLFTEMLSEEEKEIFRALWQARVGKILENFDKVITIK
ncbi:FmdE family protein [Sulfurospirillum oryzae]|uniref:FmdE family protein n=1 Tax=Sulfurospirillum oryzae TaxID=2976535 RepID=UPI0021E75B13|nr:FmdE family protein [Sulfurospirillum oryzae]